QFAQDGFTVGGDGQLQLTPTGDAPPEVRVLAGVTGTINAEITGDQGLQKAGSGTLVVSGTNTYTNGTHVYGGTLQISSDANLGAAQTEQDRELLLSDATLRVTGADYTHTDRALVLEGAASTLEIVQ